MRGYTVRARIEKEGKEEVAKDLRMSSNEREKGLREKEEGGSDRTRRGLSLFSITVPDTLFGWTTIPISPNFCQRKIHLNLLAIFSLKVQNILGLTFNLCRYFFNARLLSVKAKVVVYVLDVCV